jgi:hypothetical protein
MKTTKTIDVYRTVVNPSDLRERAVAECPQAEEGHLIHVCESVIHGTVIIHDFGAGLIGLRLRPTGGGRSAGFSVLE